MPRHRLPVSPVLLALIGAAMLESACSDSGSMPAPTPDSSTARVTDGCIEVQTWLDSTSRQETRGSWDPALRILTKETRSTLSTPQSVTTLKWRYAAEGRIIAYIGVEQPFQHDYDYDDHDNVVQFRLSYPDTPDLMTPSTAPTWIGTSYDNQYSPAGRLATSTISELGPGAGSPPVLHRTYTEDDAGRCRRIESPDTDRPYLETRTYDDRGRLVQIDATQAPAAARTTITYDDQGRVLSREATVSGTGYPGTVTTTYGYPADGSQIVTVDDGTTDVSNEVHMTLTRTAACVAIDAAIGAPADQRCSVQ